MPCCRRWEMKLALLLMLCAPGGTHSGSQCRTRFSSHREGLVPDRGPVDARMGLALRLRGGARKGGDEKRASHSSAKPAGKEQPSRGRSESPPTPERSTKQSPKKGRDSRAGGGSIPAVSPVKGVSKKKRSGSVASGPGKGKREAAQPGELKSARLSVPSTTFFFRVRLPRSLSLSLSAFLLLSPLALRQD